ncbi:hypothetical protein Asi03nite_70480 [Actinoplanes siamensis]|uniref:SMODS and SLOG-associating 2TM effector domain-containing protein n=2 Tax=Actinoplanes siamensis TaxID=1223317 RepID=A0A919NFC7_9ACTN|nr:SLATT domain-containing protein [Actinoplanes siamensis]GIF09510.1 hypothetical protein Asi03nite_70480 [Actinoplanes siamensis]
MPPSADWDGAEKILRVWLRRTREGQHMQYEAAKYFRRAHYVIAVPVLLITTVLGTATFANITNSVAATTKVWFGSLTLLAAALAALQLHFRYLERAERHKNLGARYGKIRREIEAILALTKASRGDAKQVLSDVRSELDRISNEGDSVSRRIYKRTLRTLALRDQTKQKRPETLPAA